MYIYVRKFWKIFINIFLLIFFLLYIRQQFVRIS